MQKINRIKMGKAKCSVDLGDGSERGEYVNQDYILRKLGRPHRAINLMYCYYPFDEYWPQRISEALKDKKVSFQWDYPYDDYFPYLGGIGGNTDGEPFNFMRDIRKHGQDVILTLTIDPNVTDEMLAEIGNDLRPFGRLLLRINHEATGNWFAFTKRASYQQVADFFCRASRIIREHAPNVRVILCAGGITESGEIDMEKEFLQAIRETDIWSVDQYLALHWGWPFDIAEDGGNSHFRGDVRKIFENVKASRERFSYLCDGTEKEMLISEFNTDGDVVGAYEQAEMLKEFCGMIKNEKAEWLSGFTLYQFRDRGRLGLETEDVNNSEVGTEQPILRVYREIIHDEWFSPSMEIGEEITLPIKLRWGGSEDAEGIAVFVFLEKNPCFCELYFEDESNLMIEFNGMWFYKSPKAKFIDLMPSFYEKPLNSSDEIMLKIFAPPETGENDISDYDGLFNYYFTLEKFPKIRVRYKAVE